MDGKSGGAARRRPSSNQLPGKAFKTGLSPRIQHAVRRFRAWHALHTAIATIVAAEMRSGGRHG
jgi:hypothetical protein